MNPFETLSRQDQATIISRRFAIGRNTVLSATVESMKAAWHAGDAALLLDKDGNPLLGGGKPVPQPASVDMREIEALIARMIGDRPTRKEVEGMIAEALPTVVNIHLPKGKEIKNIGVQHAAFEDLLKYISLNLNIWIAGPAGSGKSYAASEVARLLERPFFRISCGPQTPASIVFGHTTATGGYAPGIAYQALTSKEGAVLLFDEFDRMNPAVAVMVNGLLDGGAVTFPNGETLKPSPDCTYLVAANTFGKPTSEFGTAQRQDPATMSRFVKLFWPVDEKMEKRVFGDTDWVRFVQKVRAKVLELGVTSMAVTPRASEYGTKMLAAGLPLSQVKDTLLWNGVPTEDRKKIEASLR